jgi:hypothetical protein
MRRAVTIDAEVDSKLFSVAGFNRAIRASSFVGSVAFRRQLERLGDPEQQTRDRAMGWVIAGARQAGV